MASLVRRAATRAILAGGVCLLAIYVARDCADRPHDVTIVVDPRPLGDTVRAIHVDLFDHEGDVRGNLERRFGPGQAPAVVRMKASAPGAGAELHIELETTAGLRRVRRTIDAPAGSTVRVQLGITP